MKSSRQNVFILVLLIGLALAGAETWNRAAEEELMAAAPSKRMSVDFMGMRVSYPQYLRLKAIQQEVIKMDQIIRQMVRTHSPLVLAQNPHWMELLELYDAMRKMLPQDYLASVGNENPIPI